MKKKKKRKKQKQLIAKPTTRLVVGIILSLTMPFCFLCKYFIEGSVPWWILCVISGAAVAYCVYGYVKEKRDDKKFKKSLGDIENNSYFTSSEWRERYFEYVQKKPFEIPNKKGMKADLTARYRKMQPHWLWIMGIIMFLLAAFLYEALKNDEDLNEYPILAIFIIYAVPLIAVIIGIYLICVFIQSIKRSPVKFFYHDIQEYADIADIERSYENGVMLSHKKAGINIGIEYTLIYHQFGVSLIKNRDIKKVSRHVVRQKKYDTNEFTYKGDVYIHKLYILEKNRFDMEEYYLELNEFQVEMAISELLKFAESCEGNGVSEEYILPISQKLYNKKEK